MSSTLEAIAARDSKTLLAPGFTGTTSADRRDLLIRVRHAIDECQACLSLIDDGLPARARIHELLRQLQI